METSDRAVRVARDIPAATRQRVLERSGWRCERCGSGRDLQIDHRLNRSQGRDHSDANLQVLCIECHTWKTEHPRLAREQGWAVSRFKPSGRKRGLPLAR